MDLINEVDDDGSGQIEFPEFLVLMSKGAENMDQEKEFIDAFRLFDKDEKGYITHQDLKNVLKVLKPTISDLEVNEMIRELDQDGNGNLVFDEFKDLMCNVSVKF